MKYKIKLASILIASFGLATCFAQESTNTTGGDATGSGGTVVYSVGQVAYIYETGSNGNINQGVQQPYEIYTIGFIEEGEEILLNIFPNPTTGFLTLHVNELYNENSTILINDINGRTLFSQRINNVQTQIDLSSYEAGTYIFRILLESKELKKFKIIKK